MRIQNNITALNTHRQYTINNDNVAKSAEKLSSGYRINRAGDDAAGLAISEKMRSQIRGLNMATKNSQDAISLVQTAEGALQETQNMLQRMNELAVQAATGTNQEIDRNALAKEFEQLKREINDVAEQTTFNNMKILDGSMSNEGFVRSAQTSGINWQSTENVTATTSDGSTVYGTNVTGAQVKQASLAKTLADGNKLQLEMTYTDKTGKEQTVKFASDAAESTTPVNTVSDLIGTMKADKDGWSVEVDAKGNLTVTATKDFNVDEKQPVTMKLSATGTGNTALADGDLDIQGDIAVENIVEDPALAATGASFSADLAGVTNNFGGGAANNGTLDIIFTTGDNQKVSFSVTGANGANLTSNIGNDTTLGTTLQTWATDNGGVVTGSDGNEYKVTIENGTGVTFTAVNGGATTYKTDGSKVTTQSSAAAGTDIDPTNTGATVVNGTDKVGEAAEKPETKGTLKFTSDVDLSQAATAGDTVKFTLEGPKGEKIEFESSGAETGDTLGDLLKTAKGKDADGNVYTIKDITPSALGEDKGATITVEGPATDGVFAGKPGGWKASNISMQAPGAATADKSSKQTVDELTSGAAAPAEPEKYTHTMEFDPVKMKDGDKFTISVGDTKVEVEYDAKAHYTDKGTSAAERFAASVEKAFADAGLSSVKAHGNAIIYKTNDKAVSMDAKIEQKPEEWKKEDGSNPNAIRIQVGALQDEQLAVSIDSMNTAGLGLDDNNLNTQNEAGMAISAVRAAINKVSDQRATLGAMQNRLDHKIANLKVSSENLSAAESRIRDVDMASEMTNFTKNNILSQAATAMLAQANALPQNVLSLLG